MVENAKRIIELLLHDNTTVTLFMHFGHTAYRNVVPDYNSFTLFPDMASMGQLLKQHYGNDYACLALATTQGTTSLLVKGTIKTQSLQNAPESSIEYQMRKATDADTCFLSVDQLHAGSTYDIRYVGNINVKKQFLRLTPKAWMNGVVLIDKVEATNKDGVQMSKHDPHGMLRLHAAYEKLRKK